MKWLKVINKVNEMIVCLGNQNAVDYSGIICLLLATHTYSQSNGSIWSQLDQHVLRYRTGL